MTLFQRRARSGEPRPLVTFLFFLRRQWLTSLFTVVVVLIAVGYLTWFGPWQKCGRGLTAIGSPYVCVGLDLDSTALRDADPMADLEHTIAGNNSAVSEPFATIVVFQNLTPDPRSDGVVLRSLRHAVEGAITAVSRANDPKTGPSRRLSCCSQTTASMPVPGPKPSMPSSRPV
jgi:hypothetical protein